MVDDAALPELQKHADQGRIAAVVHHGDVKGHFLRGPAQGKDCFPRGAGAVEYRDGHVADRRDVGRMALKVPLHYCSFADARCARRSSLLPEMVERRPAGVKGARPREAH